jgi:hypothetical protein
MVADSQADQGGLWDVDISDVPGIVELLDEIVGMERDEVFQEKVRRLAEKREELKAAVLGQVHQARAVVGDAAFESGGARVKIGKYVQRVGVRSGGDFPIKKWTRDGLLGKPQMIPSPDP